jgi:hypothetical protein
MVSSIPGTIGEQADRIPRALEVGTQLDPGVENAGAQIAILRRKNLIANQTITILAAEIRGLKGERRQAAA